MGIASVGVESSDVVEDGIEVVYGGEPIEIGFNPRYLVDVLRSMDSRIVDLSISDPEGPCWITGDLDEGFLGLVMPMRLSR